MKKDKSISMKNVIKIVSEIKFGNKVKAIEIAKKQTNESFLTAKRFIDELQGLVTY